MLLKKKKLSCFRCRQNHLNFRNGKLQRLRLTIIYPFTNKITLSLRYIKQKVDVRITKSTVEVFYSGNRISSHPRLYGHSNQYSTLEAHMPQNHLQYVQWNGERFRRWASKIGKSTETVVSAILSGYKVEQQGYKACMGILKLADKYSAERLENACFKALTFTPRPSLKNIQAILSSGQDRIEPEKPEKPSTSQYGFTRGAEYYGRRDG